MDTGISRAAGRSRETRPGVPAGTPGVMSPGAGRGPRGRARERRLRPRCGGAVRRHRHVDVPLRRASGPVARRLRSLIERCMAVDPVRRPTAAEFRTELIADFPPRSITTGRVRCHRPHLSAPRAATPPRQVPSPAETITFGGQKSGQNRKRLPRPAALIGRFLATWKRRKLGRHAWLMAIVALAFGVAGQGSCTSFIPGHTRCCARRGSRPTGGARTRSASAGRIPAQDRSLTNT